MTVHVVAVERNTTSVNGEMFWIVGLYTDPTVAARARRAAVKEHLKQGQAVYGTRSAGDEWDVEVWMREHEVTGGLGK